MNEWSEASQSLPLGNTGVQVSPDCREGKLHWTKYERKDLERKDFCFAIELCFLTSDSNRLFIGTPGRKLYLIHKKLLTLFRHKFSKVVQIWIIQIFMAYSPFMLRTANITRTSWTKFKKNIFKKKKWLGRIPKGMNPN